MSDSRATLFILDLVKQARDFRVESTGAAPVDYSGVLYNVIGSTPDPKKVPGHYGEAWKQLLISYGIPATAPCYVTNAGAEGSHHDFSVGGHMTVNSDGSVPTGGTCYLMPLCYWHNGKKNDGVAFSHTLERVLQLSGYMQGELAATFQLRLPSPEPYAVLYFSDDRWRNQNLSEQQAESLRDDPIATLGIELGGHDRVGYYVLFERDPETQSLGYVDEASRLH